MWCWSCGVVVWRVVLMKRGAKGAKKKEERKESEVAQCVVGLMTVFGGQDKTAL